MQYWNWSSRQQASLIANHMHVADFNYSAGKLLARTHVYVVYNIYGSSACEHHGQGVRWSPKTMGTHYICDHFHISTMTAQLTTSVVYKSFKSHTIVCLGNIFTSAQSIPARPWITLQ